MKHVKDLKPSKETRAFAALLLILTICTLALYFNFIFGSDVFVFAGVGSDSIGQTVPFLLNEASRLSSGDISLWNQYQFLGAPTIQFMNLEYLPSLFGRDAIPHLMLIMQMAKIYLTGIFFYFFLGYHHLQSPTKIVAAVGLAFCGRMIELAPWTAYTIEIVFAVGILWGIERFLSDTSKVAVLPLMIAGIGLTQGVYATVLYTFVCIVYCAFRIGYIWDQEWNAKRLLSTALQLLLLLLIGYAIASPILYPSIKMYATSARVSSDFSDSLSLMHLAAPTPLNLFAEEVIKLFSNAIMGHMSSYRGYSNILNAPYYYCGLIAIITLPLAFKNKTGRQKCCLIFITVSAMFYMYSQGFRYLLNGFSVPGDDFRQSSFWVVLVIALLGSYGLECALKMDKTHSSIILIGGLVACGLFIASSSVLKTKTSPLYFFLALAFLIAYSLLLYLNSSTNRTRAKRLALAGTLFLLPLEIISQNLMPIFRSSYITADQYAAHFSGNPSLPTEYLDQDVQNSYRIDYKAIDLTNPMAHAYMGTQAYIGGAGISREVNEFLKNSPNSNVRDLGYTRYIYGYNDIAINSLLGAKYLVAPKSDIPLALPLGYRLIGENDTYVIAENEYSLPLLFSYSESDIQSIDEFTSQPFQSRLSSLLNRALISQTDNEIIEPLNERDLRQIDITTAVENGLVTPELTCRFNIPESSQPYLEVNMSLHDQATASGMLVIYIDYYDQNKRLAARYPYITANGNESISLPVQNNGYSEVEVKIASTNACTEPYLDNISYSLTSDSDYSYLSNAKNERINSSPEVISYEGNKLIARLNMQDEGYIGTSIPWDNSWKMFVNGNEVKTQVINLGFIGAKVPAGELKIELVYNDLPLYIALGSSLGLSVLLLSYESIRTIRRSKEAAKYK